MIAGHLQIKNDNYYMVLNYTDANGKRRQPWIPTGLPAKGNKRRAEKLLLDTRKSFVPPVVSKENEDISSDMLFADYMELWLEIIRSSVEKTTFSSYTQMVKGKIAPYFRNTGLTLDGIQAKHIQSFYLHELKTVSPGTVIHYHANIHKALKYAVKMDLIPFNPADKVERPKKQRYIADYYRQEELERLLEASKDHPYSLLIQMTAFYGLRRSEALGLKWDAIDFERDTITISLRRAGGDEAQPAGAAEIQAGGAAEILSLRLHRGADAPGHYQGLGTAEAAERTEPGRPLIRIDAAVIKQIAE